MTFSEAAQIAKNANADSLWLTHFSPSMPDPEMYIDEAKSIFEKSETGYDGKFATIRFEE